MTSPVIRSWQPERSHNMNVGLTYRHAKDKGVYTSEISAFYNDIDDLITLAQFSGTHYSYVNIGNYKTMGGSVGAGWDNGHWIISVGGSVTGRYDALSEARDEPILFSPELRASVTKQWLRKGWSASVFWKYQGELSSYVVVSDTGSRARFHCTVPNGRCFHYQALVGRNAWSYVRLQGPVQCRQRECFVWRWRTFNGSYQRAYDHRPNGYSSGSNWS